MQWNEPAILLSTRKYSENSLIVRALTRSQGVHAGLVRKSKKKTALYQPGNRVEASWRGRLEEHLGNFTFEPKSQIAGLILHDQLKLAALHSACIMIEQTLAERDPHPELYDDFERFLADLITHGNWLADYVRLEVDLLTHLGFGLDLSTCVATGTNDTLTYVSPKSGRAVSTSAGEPYKNKLLPLPRFLTTASGRPPPQEIRDGLTLTGFFLEKHAFNPHNKTLPAARQRCAEMVAQMAEEPIGAEA